MRVLFMGTPEIAATVLDALVKGGVEVIGAVCQPDKPKGRGYTLTPPPVKVTAQGYGIPVYQPVSMKDEGFLDTLTALSPDLICVVAYGKILPKAVLDLPPYGCINLHVSLLPRWRGAAPMQRAIMAGDRETGVTVMYMAEGLDTGDIIATERFPIGETDTFETVHDTSAAIGGPLLVRVIDALARGTACRTPQDEALATYAPKIEKEERLVDWTRDARVLDPILRGLTPIPLPYTYLPSGRQLKIVAAHPVAGAGAPGTVLSLSDRGEGEIVVACGEGALCITRLRPEGKGSMTASDFIRGRQIAVGEVLGA